MNIVRFDAASRKVYFRHVSARNHGQLLLTDRYTHLCLIDTQSGEVIEETRLATSPRAFETRFSNSGPVRVAIEASTHSPYKEGWAANALQAI